MLLERRKPQHRLRRGEVVVLFGREWMPVHPPDEVAGKVLKISPPEEMTTSYVIKRVVAVPGDSPPRERAPALRDTSESFVPQGKVILLGDNAAASYDSRKHGYFAIENIIGPVVWPRSPRRGRKESD
ncbi:S26 family signal peptidase [Nonomuraea sp. 10N515B]|uniref:S26 family signal peptidase n=1 Tax=Nonomuraea sp. 10N515B TaxID=3457422 RepID=UPI003FCE1C39